MARTHKMMIWERTRHTQRLLRALVDYFPAALVAFDDLEASDTLELLAKAPTPAQAARLTIAQISAALKCARRRNIDPLDRRTHRPSRPSTRLKLSRHAPWATQLTTALTRLQPG
ncbi:hypothetical protein [Hoyosella altamirensis]|uniref:Uncharacterized protein n=1 Tax=Hoyosella altamirensis TaxID=616997 RepID=A0A839RR37_9ACTN|nr:hypothetical protein [Hoyosella altamirensis]MBB3038827.1 hypothetical protein [Hoyosella altamirensis]